MSGKPRGCGASYAAEIFADRAYNDDATLVDRSLPGAVIHDAGHAARRIVKMVQAGAIVTESGKHIETRIDTICVHGDNAEAVALARAVRAGLHQANNSSTIPQCETVSRCGTAGAARRTGQLDPPLNDSCPGGWVTRSMTCSVGPTAKPTPMPSRHGDDERLRAVRSHVR